MQGQRHKKFEGHIENAYSLKKNICLQLEQDARNGRCGWKREEGGLGREDKG